MNNATGVLMGIAALHPSYARCRSFTLSRKSISSRCAATTLPRIGSNNQRALRPVV